MIFNFAEDVRIIDILIKKGKVICDFFLVAKPDIDDAVSFPDGIVPDVIPTDVSGRGFPICGNKSTLADLIKFKSMERALDAVILDLAQAKCSAAMGDWSTTQPSSPLLFLNNARSRPIRFTPVIRSALTAFDGSIAYH